MAGGRKARWKRHERLERERARLAPEWERQVAALSPQYRRESLGRSAFSDPKVASAGRPRPRVCEACLVPADHTLHWDHCHVTGKFRGWLCRGCNHALGFAKDSPKTLRALADYLERVELNEAQTESRR